MDASVLPFVWPPMGLAQAGLFDWPSVLAQLILGLALLACGAEVLVRGAARLARSLGVSPMAVGLTVVAFGTSSPEMAVSVFAAVRGSADIAVGNAVGSNLFNVLAILGFTALVRPIQVQAAFIRREIPIMIAVAGLLVCFGWDCRIERWEAGVFVACLVAYTVVAYVLSRRETGRIQGQFAEAAPAPGPVGGRRLDLVLIVAGTAMLIGGSHALVTSSTSIARCAGLSDTVIGLTLVAAGTSLPELAASLVAALRRQPDIALGNIVGSNIYNILFILGVAGAVRPMTIPPQLMRQDVPLMTAVFVALWPMVATGRRISRAEGGILFAGYVGYTAYRVLNELR